MRSSYLTGLLAVAVLAACDEPTVPEAPVMAVVPEASASSSGGVATLASGSGHMIVGGERRTFAFSATGRRDGSASGTFELHARQADSRIHGEVVCMTSFGGMAWIGGRVTDGPWEGYDAVFRVLDLGEGEKGYDDLVTLVARQAPGRAQWFCDFTPWYPDALYAVDGGISVITPGSISFSSAYSFSVDGWYTYAPCANGGEGELVTVMGDIQFLYHFNQDPAGGYHGTSEVRYQGISGVGATSGDAYQITGGGGGSWNASISGLPYTDTYTERFQVIGQGPGSDFTVHYRVHITVNANGEVTATPSDWSVECR